MEALTSSGQVKKDSVLPKVDSLQAVIVRPKEIRPRLHGDTMEYNTNSIQMRPNANVEELLGRLPGLRIDANGVITYNGEVIKQLLVDGEDLFASDPTIVTRNFDASRIARIQLLDRKSDQARFTGIDDGNKTKTLNLILKEDTKKGYFGKGEAGGDTQGNYNATGLLASFRQREQFAAIGVASNTGIMEGSSGSEAGGAAIFVLGDNDDPLGSSAGKGIPRYLASALHYANTWNGEADHVVGNYQYSNLLTRPITTTNTVQTLPDSIYGQYQQAHSVNRQNQHWGYGIYDWTINRLSGLKFNFGFTNTNSENQFGDTSLSTFNNIPVNRTTRSIQSTGGNRYMSEGLSWKIQSRIKTERTFSVITNFTTINGNTNGYLYSLNRFYQPDGQLESKDTVDQRKQYTNNTKRFNGGIAFTEPLWKKTVLGFNYSVIYTDNHTLQSTFNRGDGKYQDFIDSLSSQFNSSTLNQTEALTLQNTNQVFNYVLKGAIVKSSIRQKDLLADSLLNYNYLNFASNLAINYIPNSTFGLRLNYEGYSTLPSFSQLQPVRNNNDPLHIVLGNPNLRAGFNQNLILRFTRSKIWLLSLSINVGLTSNGISTRTITDTLGKQVSQPVNVDGGRRFGLIFSANKKILGLDLGLNSRFNYNRDLNYVNADLSRNDNFTAGGGISVGKYIPGKYSFQVDSRATYFDTRSSINISSPVHYWSQSHNGNLTLFFIRGFELGNNINYSWQEKSSAFAKSTSVALWNVWVARNFLDNRVVLKLQINNLLNQNAGISRTNTGNVNTETFTNILGRYWLLSVAYRFEHKYKQK